MPSCCILLQKTLPVMIAVVEQLGGALGASGLLILPCVAAHLNQVTKVFSSSVSLIVFASADKDHRVVDYHRLFYSEPLETKGGLI